MLRWSTPRLLQSGFGGRDTEPGGRLSIDDSASERSLDDGLWFQDSGAGFKTGYIRGYLTARFDSSKPS